MQAGSTEIEVLISPLVRESRIREFRIFWWSEDWIPEDEIQLLDRNETVFRKTVTAQTGLINTGYLESTDQRSLFLTSSLCSGIIAVYLRNYTSVITSSCLQTQPSWMADFECHLRSLSLSDLFIPGTHNSASYILSESGYTENRIAKYVYTQDEDVYSQLLIGARYLDIRVGSYPDTKHNWWVNHNVVRFRPLSDILQQVVHFINKTKEIVVLDFHDFPVGFHNQSIHELLATYLKSELGSYLHSPAPTLPWESTLGQVWSTDKRIILSYNKDIIAKRFNFYPPIKQYWGDVNTVSKLEDFLERSMPTYWKNERGVWAAMAHLTADTVGAFFDFHGGIRKMSDRSNRQLNIWLRDKPWHPNVLAVDFIRSVSLVSVAIKTNFYRGSVLNCSLHFTPINFKYSN